MPEAAATLVVSDLHLGGRGEASVLGREVALGRLLEALSGCERLVLLGDVLELRHGPMRDALEGAREVLLAIGEAMAGRSIVVTVGNHDHALLEPWLGARGIDSEPVPLGLSTVVAPEVAGGGIARVGEWLSAAGASVSVAYPGVWIRDDVYAHHGHYLDVHLSIPTWERLAAGGMGRVTCGSVPPLAAEDYEARLAPLYAWIDAVTRRAPTGSMLDGSGTVRAWRTLRGGDGRSRPPLVRRLAGRALAGAFPLAVGALNRLGLGPLSAQIKLADIERAGPAAMGEAADRLGVPSGSWLVFGHTHRSGPWERDLDAAWRSPGGVALMNCGCWTYDEYFMWPASPRSGYWPGRCVMVPAVGDPIVVGLLDDVAPEELAPGGLRAAVAADTVVRT